MDHKGEDINENPSPKVFLLDVSGAVRMSLQLNVLRLLLIALGVDLIAIHGPYYQGHIAHNNPAWALAGVAFVVAGSMIHFFVRASLWRSRILLVGLCSACLWAVLDASAWARFLCVVCFIASMIALSGVSRETCGRAILAEILDDRASRWNSPYSWFLVRHIKQGGILAVTYAGLWLGVIASFFFWWLGPIPSSNYDPLLWFGFAGAARYCYGRFTAQLTSGVRLDEGHLPDIYNLYLRSFVDDDLEMQLGSFSVIRLFASERFTEVVARIVWRYGPLVSVANSRSPLQAGILPTYFADTDWLVQVETLIRRANHALLVVSFTSSLVEEFRWVITSEARWKTLLVVPPEAPDQVLQRWRDMTADTMLAGIPANHVARTILVRTSRSLGVVLVCAGRRSTSSYRIALRVGLLSQPSFDAMMRTCFSL
jgi:hypothetical protein